MKRFIPILLVLLVAAGLVGTLLIVLRSRVASIASLPTAAILPEVTNTETASPTRTLAATNTHAPTVTPTLTATHTHTPTPTSTLATLIFKMTIVNPDVTLHPVTVSTTPTSVPTRPPNLNVPTPPVKLASVPSGDTPLVGWYEYDVQDARIQYEGRWAVFERSWHSINRRYSYSDDPKARLTLRFLGAAIRLRYVKYFNYGVFQVRIDGKVVTTIDSYYPKFGQGNNGDFTTTDVFPLANGWHTLEVISLAQKNPASGGIFIALDGIDVYMAGPEPTARPAIVPATPSFTPSSAPAQKVELVVAPPTIMPTPTEPPPAITAISLTIAYDKNNNKAADADEGVQGVAVRLIRIATNQVIATSYTSAEGYVHLEATGNTPLRLVVPYLNKFWDIPVRTSNMRITLLVPPANQPGLIP